MIRALSTPYVKTESPDPLEFEVVCFGGCLGIKLDLPFVQVRVEGGDNELVAVTMFMSKTAFARLVKLSKHEGYGKRGALGYLTRMVHEAIHWEWKCWEDRKASRKLLEKVRGG